MWSNKERREKDGDEMDGGDSVYKSFSNGRSLILGLDIQEKKEEDSRVEEIWFVDLLSWRFLMARICCGVVGESEIATPEEPISRAKRRRRLEFRPFEFADPPVENCLKRRKLEPHLPSSSRICENESENREQEKNYEEIEKSETDNDFDPTQSVNLSAKHEDCLKFGMTSVCGKRRDMEDAVSIHPSFCDQDSQIQSKFHFFSVFDGHGCSHVAMKCKERMHEIVKEELECFEEAVDWKDAMERSFDQMDKEACKWSNDGVLSSNCRCELQTPQRDAVGSTAVVAIITPEKLVVSNCGDSRALLCRNGAAIPLSSDHKPDRPDELARIESNGGRVIYWDGPRVFGVLAMSRAIGDSYLKPHVISEPELTITDRTAEDECLILASDGLWDVVSNDTACRVARMCLSAQRSNKACLDASILLTKLALARHSTDNVSVVVIDLKRDRL